jgi:hypothetical protein
VETAIVGAIGLVLVALLGVLGQFLTSRNDRTLTDQEVDLLRKLDPNSQAARDLIAVVESRIATWHWKALTRRARRATKRRLT